MDRLEKEKIMEAALFMSPKPLTLEDLVSIAQTTSRLEAKAMLADLQNFYNTRKSALEIVESPVGYQMRVREAYEESVQHFAQNSLFSRGVMKTLALIAYRQPINQSQVVALRNNKAYDHLKLLLDEGFIKKDPRGRTFVLTTTSKFIEYFGKDFSKSKKPVAPSASETRQPVSMEINRLLEQEEAETEQAEKVAEASKVEAQQSE